MIEQKIKLNDKKGKKTQFDHDWVQRVKDLFTENPISHTNAQSNDDAANVSYKLDL